jgi:hypothetical protein
VRLIWQPVASFALQKRFLGRLHQAKHHNLLQR